MNNSAQIAATLAERGVREIQHCHADHFEPFRQDSSGATIGEKHVAYWLEETAKLPFAAKASLFFLERFFSKKGTTTMHTDMSDIFGTDGSFATATQSILEQLVTAKRDLHVHIHHEFWTSGPTTGWPVDPVRDAQILRNYLKMLRDKYNAVSPDIFKEWLFVHGCWALNASDAGICQIIDEIAILQEFGCVGDMSFPAGRVHCDPDLKVPHTVRPCTAVKGYNTSGADPVFVFAPDAFLQNRFFLWSSAIQTHNLSLDMLATSSVLPENAVLDWVQNGWVFKGVLYLKTHAHSMWYQHWDSRTNTISPLISKPVRKAFDLLSSQNIPIVYKTAREMFQTMRGLNTNA